MKPADVQRIVGACADAAQARAKAAAVPNETTALRLRVDALEHLCEAVSDALLSGTSADPDRAPTAKSGKVKK